MSLQAFYTYLDNYLDTHDNLVLDADFVSDGGLDTTSFNALLYLIPSTQLEFSNPVVTLTSNHEITIEVDTNGASMLYGKVTHDLCVYILEDSSGNIQWELAGTLNNFKFDTLFEQNLISENQCNASLLPPVTFNEVSIAVRTADLFYQVKQDRSPDQWSIPGLSMFSIGNMGFLCKIEYPGGFSKSTTFNISGHITLGQSTDIKIEVGIISPAGGVKDTWSINISSPTPLSQAFHDLSNLLFFNDLNNLMPSDLLDDYKQREGVYIDSIKILFYAYNYSIQSIDFTIDVVKHWSISYIDFTGCLVQMRIYPNNISDTLGMLAITVPMQFDTNNAISINLLIQGINNDWTLSFTGPASIGSVFNLTNVPGSSSDVSDYDFPSGLTALNNIYLEEFTTVFNPIPSKAYFSRATFAISSGPWNLIDNMFEVENMYLSISLINGSSTNGGSYITGVFSATSLIGGTNGFEVTLRAELLKDGWIFTATATNISLREVVVGLLSMLNIDVSDSQWDANVEYLLLSINTTNNSYRGAGNVTSKWPISIAGNDFELDVDVKVDITAYTGQNPPPSSGYIQGILGLQGDLPAGFQNCELKLTYDFGDEDKYIAEFLGATLTFYKDRSRIELNLGDWSLGHIIEKMISWADPDSDATLDAPWDILNDISLKGLYFFFDFGVDENAKKTYGIEYRPQSAINIGFIYIDGISLIYGEDENGEGEVNIKLEGKLFGQEIPEWDLMKPDTAPEVPGGGDALFYIDYLGLGQHVSLTDYSSIENMDTAIQAYKDAFKTPPKTDPLSILTQTGPSIQYDENSNWMIGASFVVMATVEMAVIFNDPNLYGLKIRLWGEKAKNFAGLNFEIMYKKVSEDIGMFEATIALPAVFTHIELGEVSVIIPSFGIQIFTNGNFKIDVGFPKGLDFSQSFGVEVFPFLGFGGFYFAYLNSTTAGDEIPQITSGTFDPVIEFGIGFSIGVGKTINESILSAGLDLVIDGIFEGILAFYNPNPPPGSTTPAKSDAFYFWVQGTAAIVGELYGSIDFVVVKASVNIRISLMARATLEAYKSLTYYVEVRVTASVTVKVKIAFIKVSVDFSFDINLNVSFEIGFDQTPPWTLASDHQAAQQRRSLRRSLRSTRALQTTGFHAISMNWNAISHQSGGKTPLEIYFVPVLSVSTDVNNPTTHASDTQHARYTANLFIESPDNNSPTHLGSSFVELTKGVLAWAINSSSETTNNSYYEQVLAETITYDQLVNIYDYLACQKGGIIPVDSITGFLQAFSQVNIIYNHDETDINASIFPMLPELILLTQLGTESPETIADFSTYNMINEQYEEEILTYFEQLNVKYLNDLEQENDTHCNEYSTNNPPDDEDKSMASFMYQDYFLLLAKSSVSAAVSHLKALPYSYPGGTTSSLNQIATQYGITASSIATANRNTALSSDLSLLINGTTYTIQPGETLNDIATKFSTSVFDIVSANRVVAGLFNSGVHITGLETNSSIDYTTTGSETFQTLADAITPKSLDTNHPQYGNIPELIGATDIAFLPFLLKPETIHISLPQYQAKTGETIHDITRKFGRIRTRYWGQQNFIVPNLFVAGTTIMSDTNTSYVVQSTDTIQTLVYEIIGFSEGTTSQELDAIAQLMPLINDMDNLLQPMAFVNLYPFNYVANNNTNQTDTFDSVANGFGLTIDALVAANGNVVDVFPAGTALTLTEVQQMNVGELINQLEEQEQFNNISGMAARFMLHGLRLPAPGAFDSSYDPNSTPTYPLYELTGQSFNIPPLQTNDQYLVILERSTSGTWINFDTRNADTNAIVGDDNELIIQITNQDIANINALLGTTLNPPIQHLLPSSNYEEVGQRYTFQQSILWQYNGTALWETGDNIDVTPTIWPFPATLNHQIWLGKTLQPKVNLVVGSHDYDTAPLVTTPVANYSWGLLVPLSITEVPATVNGEIVKQPNTYQINGTDEASTLLLEQLILVNNPLSGNGIIDEIHLLYPPNSTANDAGGVMSNNTDDVLQIVLKTNESTNTSPGSFSTRSTMATETATTLNTPPKDFVELVWEASVVGTGGFFLYYASGPDGNGLPDDLFNDKDVVTLQLLITFKDDGGIETDQDILQQFMNCAIVGDAINTSNSILFAEAQARDVNYTYRSTDTLLNISQWYNIWVDDLARELTDSTINPGLQLRNGVQLALNGIIYEVKPGDTKQSIATYFGINTSQLPKPDSYYETVWNLVYLPNITYTVGQAIGASSGLHTFSAIADYFGIELAALANQNQAVTGLFANNTTIHFKDEPVSRNATIPPGNVSFELLRTAPEHETGSTEEEQYLQQLYNLLGYRVYGNTDFYPSGEGMPISNTDSEDTDDDQWYYKSVVPITPFAKNNGMDRTGIDSTLAAINPYAGLGGTVQLNFDWHDIFGDRTLTPFSFPDNYPAADFVPPLNNPPIKVRYFDPIIPLEQWPGITYGYLFGLLSGTPTLEVFFTFDATRYVAYKPTDAAKNKKANPTDPNSITLEQLYEQQAARNLQKAQADLQKYKMIYCQLAQEDVTFSMKTTVDGLVHPVSKTTLLEMIDAVYNYLLIVSATTYNYTYYTIQPGDLKGNAYATAEGIATAHGVDVDDLISINLGLQQGFETDTNFYTEYQLVIPTTSLPLPVEITQAIANTNTNDIYELNTTLTIARSITLVDDNFVDVPGVANATSTLHPLNQSISYALEQYNTNFNEAGSDQLSLNEFAEQFEQAYSTTHTKVKIATGISTDQSVNTNKGKALWVVRFGTGAIDYAISGQPVYFSPTPLANNLLSFTGANAVQVRVYLPGIGFTETITKNYSGIDLDGWGQQFLQAVDDFLMPQFMVPAYMVSQETKDDSGWEDYLQQVLDAKALLAEAIVSSTTNGKRFEQILSNPQFDAEALAHAQETMRQQLLVNLSSAYTIDAIVQFEVSMQSQFPNTNETIAPNLHGQPVVPGSTNNTDQQYSISTAKIPLTNGGANLTFLFDSKVESEHKDFNLELQFQVNQIEHEIEPVTVVSKAGKTDIGYTQSTWLNFVIPLAPDPIMVTPTSSQVDIPVPLRSYPVPPSMVSQVAVPKPDLHTTNQELLLEELMMWDYDFTYDQVEASQDLIDVQVQYNMNPALDYSNTSHFKYDETHKALFQNLAEFVNAYPGIQQDFVDKLSKITPRSEATEIEAAKVALSAFAEIVAAVAESWADWVQPTRILEDVGGSQKLTYHYKVKEEPANASKDAPLQIVVEDYNNTNLPAIDPAIIMIDGYEEHVDTNGAYTYTNKVTGDPLLYKDRGSIRQRTVRIPNLDVLTFQNAWAAVAVVRNEGLVGDNPTMPEFIYQTPMVRFANILFPFIDTTQEVDVTQFHDDPQLPAPLAQLISIMFEHIFQTIIHTNMAPITMVIKLDCNYSYGLRSAADANEIKVPIFITPPTDFHLTADLDYTVATSFSARVASALKHWYDNNNPSDIKGKFWFDLSVFSNINDNSKVPLFRIEDMYLPIDTISDLN